MNKMETAQYIVEEFLRHKKKVIKVEVLRTPFSVNLYFDDESQQVVTGKMASYIIKAEDKI